MAKSVVINGVTYADVPEVNIPTTNGGTAAFIDTTDANAVSGDMLDGKTAYVNGVKVTGNIQSKAAATYTPGTTDQTIAGTQYLSGSQTIKGDANLVAGNIRYGVSIFGVSGNLALPTISQDSTTKVLSIS